jgi:integrase
MRVFKQRGSRVYRVRYRLSDGPKIYDRPLGTHVKEVAIAKAQKLIEEEEMELAGLLGPKSVREAARRPLAEHIAEYVEHLTNDRKRGRDHLIHVKGRLKRLLGDCRWQLPRDVTGESFERWRRNQSELSAKTVNEYLAHGIALFNWMVRKGRTTYNPLKTVDRVPKKQTFERRALPIEELWRLNEGSGKHGWIYLFAGCTGLRRGEMKKLLWSDIRLDTPAPFVDVRAEIAKSRQPGIVPLVPQLVAILEEKKAEGIDFSGRVFQHGLPSVGMLHADLKASGIPIEDERGWRMDFHALRHTFGSLLAKIGVPELVRMKLTRHREWRQTDRYTDPQSLPLFTEMGKLASALPSPIASLNSGKACPKQGNLVPDQPEKMAVGYDGNVLQSEDLSNPVHDLDMLAAGVPKGIRTPVLTVKGWCPGPG